MGASNDYRKARNKQAIVLAAFGLIISLGALGWAAEKEIVVPNGDFERADAAGIHASWAFVSGKGSARADSAEKAEEQFSLRLEAEKGQEIEIASDALPLAPMRRYRMEFWVKRIQGNDVTFWIDGVASGQSRVDALQLHWPGRFRPNWFPAEPYWTRYHVFFATGRNEVSWRLRIRQRCVDDRLGRSCWVDGIVLREIGAVRFGDRGTRGQNLLSKAAAQFLPDENGKLSAWGLWWGDPAKISAARAGEEKDAQLSVRLAPNEGSIGLAYSVVPVKEGVIYHFSLWARGEGTVSLAMHALGNGPGDNRPETALRIGSSRPRDFTVKGEQWQKLEGEWIAEIPGTRWFNPYLPISGKADLRDAAIQEAER